MRLDPDDYKPDLISAYQRLHTELREMEPHAPSDTDCSSDAHAFRQSITDRQRVLQNLAYLLFGGVERRNGERLLPLGRVSVYLN